MNQHLIELQVRPDVPSPRDDLAPRYLLKFAETPSEVEEVLRLRYSVFVEEMGEGCVDPSRPGLDTDAFDPFFHHLMIIEKKSGMVIGTYRMQTHTMAAENKGFYSALEYDFSRMPDEVIKQSIEVGRACIHAKHRNGRVLFLLWKGLALYIQHYDLRYFFGCCSLTTQNPEDGLVMFEKLQEKGQLHPSILLEAQPEFMCEIPEGHLRVFPKVSIPRLMKIYLQYNASICSEPAMDRAFKTIDFLTLMDIQAMEPSLRKELFGS